MRKIYVLLIAVFIFSGLKAQVINFPDANFKAKLLSADSVNEIAYVGDFPSASVAIDTNQDGEIEVSEALAIKRLYLGNSGIEDMTGILAFSNLTRLDCHSNQLTNLNVSEISQLHYLICYQNQLVNLNFAGANVTYLDCSNNLLNNLTFTQPNYMTNLYCSYNHLTNLDLTNSNLYVLRCNNNQLENLTYSNSILVLDCSHNQLTALDVSPSGDFLEDDQVGQCNVSYNPLVNFTSLYNSDYIIDSVFMLDNCPALQHVCCYQINNSFWQNIVDQNGYFNCLVDDSCVLSTDDFELMNKITVYPNPVFDILNLKLREGEKLNGVSVNNALGQLVLKTNSKTSLDVSGLRAGNYFIKINSDRGTSNCKFIKI